MTNLRAALDRSASQRPPRAKKPATEHPFHACLYEYLELALPDDAILTSLDHANAASAVTGALRKWRGVLSGIPDILITWQPDKAHRLQIVVWFECKRRVGGTLLIGQEIWRDIVIAAGHYWGKPRTLEDAIVVLDDAGIPLKARPSG